MEDMDVFILKIPKKKQKYGTTEKAIESMNILGLRRGNELVDKLCLYMEKILNNEIAWPDGYEKNKWYRAAQPIFVISKLSNFTSEDKAYIWTLKPASLVH